MTNVILALTAAVAALLATWRQRHQARRPALAVIVSPRHSTVISKDGAVRSAQTAELSVSRFDCERLWNPTNLENLARTYWRFLSRVFLGLVRVVYGDGERRVVFLFRALTLLRFEAPEYVLEENHGRVTWRILDGLLVARSGRGSGFLALDVTRQPPRHGDEQAKLRIEVEVANFYPSIAAGFSSPVYEATQSAIHLLVTHAFLRSLANLRLSKSKVGRLAPPAPQAASASEPEPQRAREVA
jgi:hypothetical protein